MSVERTDQALGEVPLVDHEEGLHTGAALLAAFQEVGRQMSNSVTAVALLGCFSEHSKTYCGRWSCASAITQRIGHRDVPEPGVAIAAWLVTPQRTANIA